MKQVHNFNAGPAVLPPQALLQAQAGAAGLSRHGHVDPGDQPPLANVRSRDI